MHMHAFHNVTQLDFWQWIVWQNIWHCRLASREDWLLVSSPGLSHGRMDGQRWSARKNARGRHKTEKISKTCHLLRLWLPLHSISNAKYGFFWSKNVAVEFERHPTLRCQDGTLEVLGVLSHHFRILVCFCKK